MREDFVWRVVAKRLSRSIPPSQRASVLGDLAEDYSHRRVSADWFRARAWLIREARSLSRAFRHAEPSGTAGNSWGVDARHAARRIRSEPGRAVLCAALLAVAIGLATAMFSVVDSVMFRRAPFSDADQLVEMGLWQAEPRVMDAWHASGMFQGVGAYQPTVFRFAGDGDAPVDGAVVTPSVFTLLGVAPLYGRPLTADDAAPGRDSVVVLSEVVWRSRFGADRSLIGRQVRLNDESVVVVGIMPAAFRFPTALTRAWKPLDPARNAFPGGARILGRLRPGVAWDAAELQTGMLAREFGRMPRSYRGRPPLRRLDRSESLDPFIRQALALLLGGTALVFVVISANVSSLLLAGLIGRYQQFGVCAALGASRFRLLRQVSFEHLYVAVAGAGLGTLLAWLLLAIVPELFVDRTLNPIDLDVRALLVAAALGMAAVIVAGVLPAWLGTRADAITAIRTTPTSKTASPAGRRASRVLLITEVALACALLTGSVLLTRSFANLATADRGVTMDGLVHVQVHGIDETIFASRDAYALGLAAIQADTASWPEVSAVALTRVLPPTWDTGTAYVGTLPPAPEPPPVDASADNQLAYFNAVRAQGISVDQYFVDRGFFDLFGVQILRGRALHPGDPDRAAVVGARLAELLWPGADAIGRTFAIGNRRDYRVVGVAREIRMPTLDATLDRPEVYLPLGTESSSLTISLRCRTTCPDVGTIDTRLKRNVPGVSARMIVDAERPYLAQLDLPEAIAQIGGVFALVAVLVAAGGLFSVMTYAVSQRHREFGIRAALGAAPAQMRLLIVRGTFTLVAVGTAFGLVGGWLVARGLAAFQYGVTSADPATWLAVIATLGCTSLLACWRPAQRAARVDPLKLLREE